MELHINNIRNGKESKISDMLVFNVILKSKVNLTEKIDELNDYYNRIESKDIRNQFSKLILEELQNEKDQGVQLEYLKLLKTYDHAALIGATLPEAIKGSNNKEINSIVESAQNEFRRNNVSAIIQEEIAEINKQSTWFSLSKRKENKDKINALETLKNNIVSIRIELPSKDFDKEIEEKYNKFSQNIIDKTIDNQVSRLTKSSRKSSNNYIYLEEVDESGYNEERYESNFENYTEENLENNKGQIARDRMARDLSPQTFLYDTLDDSISIESNEDNSINNNLDVLDNNSNKKVDKDQKINALRSLKYNIDALKDSSAVEFQGKINKKIKQSESILGGKRGLLESTTMKKINKTKDFANKVIANLIKNQSNSNFSPKNSNRTESIQNQR